MRRIGIIGDSQSEGLGPHLVPLLEARGDRVTGTMLVRGMSIRSLRNDASKVRQAREIADNADTLIVILGGNNQLAGAAYRNEMKWFLEELARAPQTIWWVGPASTTAPRTRELHLATRALQRSYLPAKSRVTWIDAWPMTDAGVEHAPDGLHFTRAGYAVWARRLLPELADTSWGTWIGAGLLGAAVGVFLAFRRR